MIKLKGCPRCGGDMVLGSDRWGWYQHCLQCGMNLDLPEMAIKSANLSDAPWLGS